MGLLAVSRTRCLAVMGLCIDRQGDVYWFSYLKVGLNQKLWWDFKTVIKCCKVDWVTIQP